MRPSKRKSVPVTVKVGSQPSVPKKMGHFRWLSYYWDDFTFTRKYRELYLFQKFSELWEMEKVLGFEVRILCFLVTINSGESVLNRVVLYGSGRIGTKPNKWSIFQFEYSLTSVWDFWVPTLMFSDASQNTKSLSKGIKPYEALSYNIFGGNLKGQNDTHYSVGRRHNNKKGELEICSIRL